MILICCVFFCEVIISFLCSIQCRRTHHLHGHLEGVEIVDVRYPLIRERHETLSRDSKCVNYTLTSTSNLHICFLEPFMKIVTG